MKKRAARSGCEVTKDSKLKNRLSDHRFFTDDFRSDRFFWVWSILIDFDQKIKKKSTALTWPKISLMSTFYTQYIHTFAQHYKKLCTGLFGTLQRTRQYFFNAHWVGFVSLCALLLKWTSYFFISQFLFSAGAEFSKKMAKNP